MILCIYLLISSILWVAFWPIISFLLWFKNSWIFFSFPLVRMQWYLPNSLHAGLEKSLYFSFAILVTSLMFVLGQLYTFQFIKTCFKFTNLFPVKYKNTIIYSSFSSFPFVHCCCRRILFKYITNWAKIISIILCSHVF